jgi:hypothetical protein
MPKIGDLLERDLTRTIEEIVKLDQTDQQSVYAEITEYVATDRIKDQYRDLLKAIAEAPSDPNEGIGIWISGFFGSGKSSFAKNIGYILGNLSILDTTASQLFKDRSQDTSINELIDYVNQRIPTEVIMFDISTALEVRTSNEKIAEVMYRALLSHLEYATDFDIAELEIELEGEGKLKEFESLSLQVNQLEWSKARKGARKWNHASAILHAMDSQIFPQADSWAKSIGKRVVTITVQTVVDRAFELISRRRPGKALAFVVDEVGQYVARSAEKIEDLRAVVEQFGKESKNRIKTQQAIAPIWVIVTSQEKLDEVVAAIDDKRVEIAKLQDRFKHRIDMAPADIREIATRRVLAKTPEAEIILRQLFQQHSGMLSAVCKLERTTRQSEVNEADFIQFYPYLPHFIELSIDIMSGIRSQRGAMKHLGGSNRTIIKQAYEMLVSNRTAMKDREVGVLVTLDKVFELVEGNLSSEKQKDISDIARTFEPETNDVGMVVKVAKAICLLELVRDLPRTEANLAACLIEMVGDPAPLEAVKRALERLYEAKFIRNTDEGWKLQTAQEKNWETERRAISPKPRDRNELLRDSLKDIFGDAKLQTYKYAGLKNFRVGLTVDSNPVSDGNIPIVIITAADDQDFQIKLSETCDESRQNSHSNDLYWTFALTAEIDALIANLFSSRQMINRYEQMRSQNRITSDESACLEDEKGERSRVESRLREKLSEALQQGAGLFRGVEKRGADLGRSLSEIFKGLFDYAVPMLYEKLRMGVRSLKGSEAEEVLKAANLNALSDVFYGSDKGLNLVIKEGAKYVPNPNADIAKEILNYMQSEHSYGNKITGKQLDDRFSGIGYGWDRDILRLVLAVLLRAGKIEVTYQGRRFRGHLDAQCRVPFTNNNAFKAASFAPHESIELKTLVGAVKNFEELTGEEVDVEEGAIAAAFKKFAEAELRQLLPIVAISRANQLPIVDLLEDYNQTLNGIQTAASDDCVKILVGEGKSLQSARDRVRAIQNVFGGSSTGIFTIQNARRAVGNVWRELETRSDIEEKEALASNVETLRSLLQSENLYAELPQIATLADSIETVYRSIYNSLHNQRHEAYSQAIDELKGRGEWAMLPEGMDITLLAPLRSRACLNTANFLEGDLRCRECSANLSQMDSDLLAVQGLKNQVLTRIQELIAQPIGEEPLQIERVQIAQFFSGAIDSEETFEEAVEQLREYLHKLWAAGVKVIVE